jgi:hypothetical protein
VGEYHDTLGLSAPFTLRACRHDKLEEAVVARAKGAPHPATARNRPIRTKPRAPLLLTRGARILVQAVASGDTGLRDAYGLDIQKSSMALQ